MSALKRPNLSTAEGIEEIQWAATDYGTKLAILDIEEKQAIQDAALLQELAWREFDLWFAEVKEQPAIRDTPFTPSEVEIIQYMFVQRFCKGYTNWFEQVDEDGVLRRRLLKPRVSLPQPSYPRKKELLTPEFMKKEATNFDPLKIRGIENIKKESYNNGNAMVFYHSPHAVITDPQELREYAKRQCAEWWTGLENTDAIENKLSEVERIYVSSFIASYNEYIDVYGPEKAKKRRTQATNAVLTLTERRDQPDGITYEAAFVDSARMTQPVSFAIHVSEDGMVELQEL